MTEKDLILLQLRQAFNERSWHGTNLYGSIRGLSPDLAAWRAAPDRHNIWELIVHAAYWKYAVLRRLSGEKRGSFALKGSNFFARPGEHSVKALKSDIGLLKDYHASLLKAVTKLKSSDLDTIPVGSKMSHRDVIIGVAAHDNYHAGQIQLLKRLYPKQ